MSSSATHGHTMTGSLDITEDLTETQLAHRAMATEVVVSWYGHGEHHYGIVIGYQDPKSPGEQGVFVIDEVEDSQTWPETGAEYQLKRSEFVVFGPANRDPGDGGRSPDAPLVQVALPTHAQGMLPFLLCAMDVMGMETEIGNPTFKVRLDARPHPSGGYRFRVGVQPVEQPIMHDEIYDVLFVASNHELAVSTSSAGLDITAPTDLA